MLSGTAQNQNGIMAFGLDTMEIDTIGEILNISMGSAATAVSTLLSRKVNITTPTVSVVKSKELKLDNLEPAIGIEIEYVEGLNGHNLMVMKRTDIKSIVNLLLGETDVDAENDELDEIHISAISEIMNQMMGASSTALANFLGKSINISTPKTFDIATKLAEIGNDAEQPFVVSVSFTLEVEELLNSEFVTVMPVDFTKELVKNALNFDDPEEMVAGDNKSTLADSQPVKSKTAPELEKPKKEREREREEKKGNGLSGEKTAPVSVKPVKLQSFDEDRGAGISGEEQDNFNLILGVPLDISVEIGRTKMAVKNILDIRQGSIVELDRLAGDPVDIIVNGQLIAKGDVVIIDDNFGVRITEILSPRDMSRKLS